MAAAEDGGAEPHRPVPPCSHFGTCGGCAAQDMAGRDYRRWKRGFVEAALRRAGVAAEVSGLVAVPPASRRRARFFARRGDGALSLGFRAAASHEIVDMTACLVLTPAVFALAARLRGFLADTLAPGASAEAEVQEVEGALDVLLRMGDGLDLALREGLVAFARDAGIARISHQPLEAAPRRGRRPRGRRPAVASPPETVAALGPVTARFGGVPVPLPPLAFLQASAAGEAALVEAVTAAVPDGAAVVDLYSGAGTFTFPLSRGRRVAAFDGDADLIGTLDGAARAAGLGATVAGSVRNLARRPLLASELAGFDAAVLDPPRAGAAAQARALAASDLSLVVMVSCDPASFARDARILIDGGFSPGPVVPVDQFVWTRHLELVAAFSR
ncbi:MAG: class I SAM-dependent RNA methyltransferase [Alphaproteobacteria bacterium]|nr:class I SAM-dependent RNA methyltransferase [Alphaproteobacteria bacterium]